MKSYLGQNNLPRGIRNNNPGNLVITGNAWVGKLPLNQNTDGRFEQFTSLEYGIRAMAYDITGDVSRGLNTLTKLVTAYAPPSENNTQGYINSVSAETGISPDETLVLSYDALKAIVRAKINVENGAVANQYITDTDIENGINLLPATMLAALKKKLPWKPRLKR